MKNVLENIKVNDVISIGIDRGVVTGDLLLLVDTNSEGEVQHPLTNAFEIYYSNEFLRSLNLIYPSQVEFNNYPMYSKTISLLNKLLAIRKAMEKVSGRMYGCMDILAYQIYDVILNRLLAKHNFAYVGWEQAMKERPLEDWVKEAITYFK